MASVLLVPGPPFGAALWEGARRRFADLGHPAEVVDLLDEAPEPTPGGLARALAARIDEDTVLVAHYTAVPVAMAAAAARPPRLLVLSNGPVERLDPLTRAACAAARRAPRALAAALRPGPATALLASSAGLRRAVVNPYVMDRDTVVAIATGALARRERRARLVAFLAGLPEAVERAPEPPGPTLLAWGAADPLHPVRDADAALARLPRCARLDLPGARLGHPVEQPWALPDRVSPRIPRRGPTAT